MDALQSVSMLLQKPVVLLLKHSCCKNIMAERDEILMNPEEAPEIRTIAEQNVLALVREMEWAEAYVQDHPGCGMGAVYLNFLHWELVMAQAEM